MGGGGGGRRCLRGLSGLLLRWVGCTSDRPGAVTGNAAPAFVFAGLVVGGCRPGIVWDGGSAG